MSAEGHSRLCLCAAIPRMRLTGVLAGTTGRDTGAIEIGQRVCWAACLGEFEQVEICNLTRGSRAICHVRFGAEGELRVTPSAGALMQPGDHVRIRAFGWLPAKAVAGHTAIEVTVDEQNSLVEFRRMTPRLLTLDPGTFTPPPAIDVIVDLARPQPAEAVD